MQVFWFELAGHLGKTVVELQETMTWREFIRWLWLYNDHPFGELAADLRVADNLIFQSNLNATKKSDRREMIFIGKQGSGAKRESDALKMTDANKAGQMLRDFVNRGKKDTKD